MSRDDPVVTADLSKFGYRELSEAADLLKAYADNPSVLDGDDVSVSFNMNSGYVFLSDEDFNTALINHESGKLEKWYNCPVCGHEGFHGEMCHNTDDPECAEYLESIDVAKECQPTRYTSLAEIARDDDSEKIKQMLRDGTYGK